RNRWTRGPGENAGPPAGGKAADEASGPRGMAWRPRKARPRRQRGSAGGQTQKLSAGKFHGVPSRNTAERQRAVSDAPVADPQIDFGRSPADGKSATARDSASPADGPDLSYIESTVAATAAVGPTETSRHVRYMVAIGGTADITSSDHACSKSVLPHAA